MSLRHTFRKWFTRRPGNTIRKHSTAKERLVRPTLEHLEDRLAPAALPVNPNFEDVPDFTGWNVNPGPSAFTPNANFEIYDSNSETIVRGPGAPEGNAYAHLAFQGDNVGLDDGFPTPQTSFGPSIQSSTFQAPAFSFLSVSWRATDGESVAHPRGRLFDAVTNLPVGTFFDTDTGTTAFNTSFVQVPFEPASEHQQFYLVFEAGSTGSGDQQEEVGASLDIDAIHRSPAPIDVTTLINGHLSVDVCNDFDQTNQDDSIKITLDTTGQFLEIYSNGSLDFIAPMSTVDQVNVFGGGGNDHLTVDSSNGLITIPNGIRFDGDGSCPEFTGNISSEGGDFDTLILTQTGGATQTSDVYSVGPNIGDGIDVITGPGGTQTVFFQNLAPVQDNVPATTATVNATPSNNAINYSQGPGGGIFVGNTGIVTDDNQESYEFNYKDHLVINALAGSDEINLHYNNTSSPAGATPGGLKDITVNGADPTASDTLIVNGISGVLDNLRYLPTSVGAGTVINDNAPQPNVLFTGIEHLNLVVQQADGDGVRIDGTIGNDAIEFLHGATSDSGSFVGTLDQTMPPGPVPSP